MEGDNKNKKINCSHCGMLKMKDEIFQGIKNEKSFKLLQDNTNYESLLDISYECIDFLAKADCFLTD